MAIEKRTSEAHKKADNTSVYLARVVNHLDTRFMGGLEVELLKRRGDANTTQYVQCKYASPFYGTTAYSGAGKSNTYASTQKSYGFWAVPPDIGTLVLVVLAEGDPSQAYWIGCVPETGMNFMTPGYASTEYSDGGLFPVGEYNKKSESGAQTDPTKYTKPVNPYQRERLTNAGLDKDWVRGTNTSSARRDMPSMVFGISTPGPIDKDGPKHKVGKDGFEINAPYNRLGGSSFVMDDGDMSLLRKKPAKDEPPQYAQAETGDRSGDSKIPANELIRIQTRSGHQILLHNSEDLIYIAHGSGDSWIEMTANGKIDIYAKDSISIRSENDINFTAERDVNIEAKRNINFYAVEDIRNQADKNFVLRAGENGTIEVGSDYNLKASGFINEASEGGKNVNITGPFTTTVDGGIETTASTMMRSQGDAGIEFKTGNGIKLTADGAVQTYGGSRVTTNSPILQLISPQLKFNSGGFVQRATTPNKADAHPENEDWAMAPKRAPAREPWAEHENIDPKKFVPEETEAVNPEEREEQTQEEGAGLPPIPDTFKKA